MLGPVSILESLSRPSQKQFSGSRRRLYLRRNYLASRALSQKYAAAKRWRSTPFTDSPLSFIYPAHSFILFHVGHDLIDRRSLELNRLVAEKSDNTLS